ncbi:unnamed protein product [Larinioides sclopetarius]|uniref:Uncharacterized protein n=1 Tax=Larinioides sclopetarius TaxID=280406 RepID=A0AAV2AUD4_9ARAC
MLFPAHLGKETFTTKMLFTWTFEINGPSLLQTRSRLLHSSIPYVIINVPAECRIIRFCSIKNFFPTFQVLGPQCENKEKLCFILLMKSKAFVHFITCFSPLSLS